MELSGSGVGVSPARAEPSTEAEPQPLVQPVSRPHVLPQSPSHRREAARTPRDLVSKPTVLTTPEPLVRGPHAASSLPSSAEARPSTRAAHGAAGLGSPEQPDSAKVKQLEHRVATLERVLTQLGAEMARHGTECQKVFAELGRAMPPMPQIPQVGPHPHGTEWITTPPPQRPSPPRHGQKADGISLDDISGYEQCEAWENFAEGDKGAASHQGCDEFININDAGVAATPASKSAQNGQQMWQYSNAKSDKQPVTPMMPLLNAASLIDPHKGATPPPSAMKFQPPAGTPSMLRAPAEDASVH